MNEHDDRIKLDIFRSKTTYQNDYKKFPLEPRKDTLNCQAKFLDKKDKPPSEYVPKDNETFAARRPDVYIPFNLLWRRKEITGTDPHVPFETPVIPENAAKENVIKTRPRVYMSPAVSIDDVSDPEMRNLLLAHMYTSEWTKAIQESSVKPTERHIPNTTVEQAGDPVQLKVDLLPPLPDNFRKIGKNWENEQLKLTVDPNKMFWEHKDPPVKCGACFDPVKGLVPEETKEEIRTLISQDRLRLAHDAPIPGYAGYKPRFSYGVSLAKVAMPVVHPFLSVSQAITKRYEVDKSK
ncbi:uncharacterized protein LOC103314913 [Tribolium castaneum]|uniref:Uncharacterized protein n=1 Tax=Tribolium castaneum TaxID=7070 RepID=D6WKM2_TRICA|nr:PREDICTED: uncharacterized protein LOC103314913 [Tribolium castaneum]EFA03016.1 hypothetical protein TcasGA2_TC010439 [Tribolium castaneum]|eukprot:XP_015835274.1 PREDICTED: uncharacterized protein LOC103314913 [Tribolium castaneum]